MRARRARDWRKGDGSPLRPRAPEERIREAVPLAERCGLVNIVAPRGEAGQITVFGKNGRTRSIALPAPLWLELIALRGKGMEDPVVPSRSGKPLDRGRSTSGR